MRSELRRLPHSVLKTALFLPSAFPLSLVNTCKWTKLSLCHTLSLPRSLPPSTSPPPVFLLSEIHPYSLSHKGGKVSLWKQGGEISKSYLLRRELRQQKVWVAVKQLYTRSMYSSFSFLFGSLDVTVNAPPPCQPATTFLPLPACVSACRHLLPLCWRSEALCSLKCMALLGQLSVCVCGIYFIYLFFSEGLGVICATQFFNRANPF